MDAGSTLDLAYAEWRRLAEAEGKAIRAGDWRFVADCQQALRDLRPTLDHFTEQERRSAPRVGITGPRRSTILELIELQRQNLASLLQRREKLSAQMKELSRTARNLRELRRSYSPPPPPAWNTYS